MRKQASCLEKEIMQGTMPGACRWGRPCTAWTDCCPSRPCVVFLYVQDSLWKSQSEDMVKWRKYVHGVANPQIEDG